MLLLILETRHPLDAVVFFDTGMEFQAISDIRNKVKPILEKNGVIYTELVPPRPFLYDMLECPHTRRKDGITTYGYGWCGGLCRWGTTEKLKALDRYAKSKKATVYIGIAADEEKRIVRARQKKRPAVSIFPLVEWGMTEADCLEYCYKNGWKWLENGIDLYDILDRVSCWCCSNKNQKEIKNIMQYLPEYWERIKVYEKRCGVLYKGKGCTYFERKFNEDINE